MKNCMYEQYATVKEDTATLFTARLNEQLRSLKHNHPSVTFSEADPLCAYIKYFVDEQAPETVAEASEMEGVRFTCAQCPEFKPMLKDDGTADKRCKYGDCAYVEMGRTYKTSAACDRLYELIKEGQVKICFTE